METTRAGEVLIRRDGVSVKVLGADSEVDAAIALLDDAESQVRAPLVDESERSRLHALAEGQSDPSAHWHPLLATVDGRPTGYAGIVLPGDGDGAAESDLAPDRLRTACEPTVTALFAGLHEIGRRHRADGLHVWIRHAADPDERCARAEGFEVQRRLVVMGRDLTGDLPAPAIPDGVTVRPFRPGDEDAVVAVLRDAYEGTPEAGWDRERFDERRSYGWFDPDDVLLAEDGDGIAGLHWTKRRGDGVGEVYNLAVAGRRRGSGLGRALLRAGLRHLADLGCGDVILWVDRANEAGVSLYRSEGFDERWIDVAFARPLVTASATG